MHVPYNSCLSFTIWPENKIKHTNGFECCGKEMNGLCQCMAYIVHASHLANTIGGRAHTTLLRRQTVWPRLAPESCMQCRERGAGRMEANALQIANGTPKYKIILYR